jgi:hypothetical protein
MSLINQCGNSYRAHWHKESSNQNRDKGSRDTQAKSYAEALKRGFELGFHISLILKIETIVHT